MFSYFNPPYLSLFLILPDGLAALRTEGRAGLELAAAGWAAEHTGLCLLQTCAAVGAEAAFRAARSAALGADHDLLNDADGLLLVSRDAIGSDVASDGSCSGEHASHIRQYAFPMDR